MKLNKKHIEVVAAIIVRGDSVYCFKKGKNKFDYLSGKFEFQGGKIEVGEEKQQALVREISEELSVVITVQNELLQYSYEYPDFVINLTCFKAEIESGNFVLSEHTEVILQRIDQLNSLEWLPADIPAVNYLMETNR